MDTQGKGYVTLDELIALWQGFDDSTKEEETGGYDLLLSSFSFIVYSVKYMWAGSSLLIDLKFTVMCICYLPSHDHIINSNNMYLRASQTGHSWFVWNKMESLFLYYVIIHHLYCIDLIDVFSIYTIQRWIGLLLNGRQVLIILIIHTMFPFVHGKSK